MDRSKESSSCTLPVIRPRKGVAFWTLKYRPITVVALSWMWFAREMQSINRFIYFKRSDMYLLNERADLCRKESLASSKAMNVHALEPFLR